jgi:16S rRNA (cytosine1402-N4)-methyltransferase
MLTESYHLPVMPGEVEQYLITDEGGRYVDCTLGGGGHSRYLLERHDRIEVIGLDWDEDALGRAGEVLAPFKLRFRSFRENFRNMKAVIEKNGLGPVQGVLADLGVSSWQLDNRERGFSFESSQLDMRMDRRLASQAEDLINSLTADELADIFYQYGEERLSRPIARAIVNERAKARITTGMALADIVSRIKRRTGKTHPATLVFQGLRIAVNREMENLQQFLDEVPQVLAPGGRVVVLSYHSLEDRQVKNSFRSKGAEGRYRVLTKKVVFPSETETKNNPRSRSARLRAAERI